MIRLPHLETNVTQACQNRCAGCNHFVPMTVSEFKSSMLDPIEFAQDLFHFAKVAHVDAYAMIGGEPTLHPSLVELLRIARSSGVADTLEVWTNGQDFSLQPPAFWKSFDVLVWSRYRDKVTDAEAIEIERRCAEAGVRLRVIDERTVPNFSRLLEPEPTTDSAALQVKYNHCFFKSYSRVLDRGYFFRCCTSPYIPRLLQGRAFGSDGLRVDENLTERELRSFLDRPIPMLSCLVCAGRDGRGDPLPWSEESNPEAWARKSAGLS